MLSLVTGGAGFIGSHVTEHCLSLGHEVVVLDDLTGGSRANIPHRARFIQGSVTDTPLVSNLFDRFQFDYVYHLAAYAAEGLSHYIRNFNYSNNLLGSVNLVNEAVKHEVRCFVFTSSIAVYGAGQLPMTEEQHPMPEDPYGIAKYAVELDLHAAHRLFGLDFVIFRPHNVYGVRQNLSDRYRNVVGIFMNQALNCQPMTIFGDGSQTRAFTYIDDVAPIVACSPEVPQARNDVFNIGADQPVTVRRIAELVAAALRVEPRIAFLPARTEALHVFSSHEKVQRIFGARATIGIEDGISEMARWAGRLSSLREQSIFGPIEVRKNLPQSWRVA
jgi:UDP-glucose 4-epimerase